MNAKTLADARFNADGLIPAVIQDAQDGAVLMLGYMNAESLAQTVATGRVVFWSRSRKELWRKGDTSGNIQLVRDVRLDCDADTLLITVEQVGPACHTGSRTCFDDGQIQATTSLTRGDSA